MCGGAVLLNGRFRLGKGAGNLVLAAVALREGDRCNRDTNKREQYKPPAAYPRPAVDLSGRLHCPFPT